MTRSGYLESNDDRWGPQDDTAVEQLLLDAMPPASFGDQLVPKPNRPTGLVWLGGCIGQVSLARDCPFCNGLRG